MLIILKTKCLNFSKRDIFVIESEKIWFQNRKDGKF